MNRARPRIDNYSPLRLTITTTTTTTYPLILPSSSSSTRGSNHWIKNMHLDFNPDPAGSIEFIKQAKRAIRHQMNHTLTQIDRASLLQQAQQVLDRFKTLKYLEQPKVDHPSSAYDRISCYRSMDSAELPTDSIIRYLLNSSQLLPPFSSPLLFPPIELAPSSPW